MYNNGSMTLCYYVTGHGYGHAVRTVQILRALPPKVRIVVKTTIPARVFTEELPGRDLTVIPAEYDCGCVQSDSVTVLEMETLARYRAIAQRNEAILANEIAFLRREKVRCVVSDIASFPLRAARATGVAGIAIANFTWLDIYREYTQTAADALLLSHMTHEYEQATLALITALALPQTAATFPHARSVPLVARPGTDIRQTLCRVLGLPSHRRLALMYLGVWGMDIDWQRVERLSDWAFVTFELAMPPAANVFPLLPSMWSYADVAASVDAVLAKTGYGTVTGCIAAGVPLLYPPRAGFAEHTVLAEGLARWGGGIPVTGHDFRAGNWAEALKDTEDARPDPQAFATNGAAVIAATLENYL